jgi:hypothetical protein
MADKVNVRLETGALAFVLYIIAFWGEPDIVDALIRCLLKGP